MDRAQHPSNTKVLGAPKNWDQKELPCTALPVTETDIEGIPAIKAYFKPTPEEIEIILQGGYVCLWVIGTTTAPVSLTAEN